MVIPMLKKCVCCLCIALFCTVSLQAQDTSRQTVSETQAEIRYYAPKLKFESRGLPSYNFRDTLQIQNSSAPEYIISHKNWYIDYIRIYESGNTKLTHSPYPPLPAHSKLNLDYVSLNWKKTFHTTDKGSAYWLAGLRYYRFDTSLSLASIYTAKNQLNQFAPAIGIGGKYNVTNTLSLFGEFSGLPLGKRGHVYDFNTGMQYRLSDAFSVSAGYRVLDLKIKNDADGTGIYKLSGWYGGVSYHF